MKNEKVLGYLSDAEKDDLEVVKKYLAYNGFNFGYASPRLQGDKDIVLSLLKDYDLCLGDCTPMLRADPEVYEAFVAKDESDRVYILTKEEAERRTNAPKDYL